MLDDNDNDNERGDAMDDGTDEDPTGEDTITRMFEQKPTDPPTVFVFDTPEKLTQTVLTFAPAFEAISIERGGCLQDPSSSSHPHSSSSQLLMQGITPRSGSTLLMSKCLECTSVRPPLLSHHPSDASRPPQPPRRPPVACSIPLLQKCIHPRCDRLVLAVSDPAAEHAADGSGSGSGGVIRVHMWFRAAERQRRAHERDNASVIKHIVQALVSQYDTNDEL